MYTLATMGLFEYIQDAVIDWASYGPDLYGTGIPAVLGVMLMIWSFFSGQKAASPLIGFMTWLAALPITIFLSYSLEFWAPGHLGLHIFSGFVVVFVFLAAYRQIPIAWVYPLAFLSCVVPDVVSAGNQLFWKFTAFSGVGGAGFMDGNFWVPLVALSLAVLMRYVVTIERRKTAIKRLEAY